jgi:hypothetical protein
MPGESVATGVVSETQQLLKIVQNKIRNLRKAVDKATAIEAASARGESLQPDQQESLRSKPSKVILLAELEEIFKKQAAIVGEGSADGGPADAAASAASSKRAAKRREKEVAAAAAAAAAAATESEKELSERDVLEDAPVTELSSTPTDDSAPAEPASDVATNGSALESRPAPPAPVPDFSGPISQILSLLHVVDFLKTPDAKSSVLGYFTSDHARASPGRIVSAYDLELVAYFTLMATSPNGDVPHALAVETSTAHCLSYLDNSDADAFTGTTYSTLVSIIDAIASCPLLANRGAHIPPTAPANGVAAQSQLAFGTGGLVAEDPTATSPAPAAGNTAPVAPVAPGFPGAPAAPATETAQRPAPSSGSNGRGGAGRGRGGRGGRRGGSGGANTGGNSNVAQRS